MITVGIDIAKRTHEACFMGADGQEVSKSLRFTNSQAGVRALLDDVRALEGPVTIGLEATGHYWLGLHEQLIRSGFSVQVLNPIQTHAYRRTTVRKVKNDRRDAWIVADLVRIGRARAAYVPDDTIFQLRELTRFRWSLVDQIGDAKRRALTILDRVFPEYEGLFSDVFIQSSRALLARATTAADFADADIDELAAVLTQASRGRLGRERAEMVQAAARNSLGTSRLGGVARFELSALTEHIGFLENQVAETEEEIADLLEDFDQYLTTIPGVGPVLAASLLAEIGDVSRFPGVKSLVAYAGIDPVVFRSGEFEGTSTHMSKRGSPFLRRALWLAAVTASRTDPDLNAYLHRRLAEGKPQPVVMGAIARRLLARIYAMLRDHRPYEPAQRPLP